MQQKQVQSDFRIYFLLIIYFSAPVNPEPLKLSVIPYMLILHFSSRKFNGLIHNELTFHNPYANIPSSKVKKIKVQNGKSAMRKQTKHRNNKITRISAGILALALFATPVAYLISQSSNTDALEIWSVVADNGSTKGGTDIIIKGEFEITANIIQVSGGENHTLALDDAGNVYAWGSNSDGQVGLGLPNHEHQATPKSLSESGKLRGKKIVQIATGSDHSLALDSDGKIYAWGANWDGRLGDGSTDKKSSPVAVDTTGALDGKKIVQIAAGSRHSLALDSDGKVYAWGQDYYGQLGDNRYIADQASPVQVDTSGALSGKTITKIASGAYHSLALDSNGKIFAWGDDDNGQLGNGITGTTYPIPVAINTGAISGKTINHIAAGEVHTLATDNSGTVYSWGNNWNGQLGNGVSQTTESTPIVANAGAIANVDIIQIAAGNSHSVAMDDAGKVYAWGYNGNGAVGNNSSNTSQATPVETSSYGDLVGKDITQVSAGGYTSLALDNSGRIYAWGSDTYGQLGIGTEYVYGEYPFKQIPTLTDTGFGTSDLTYVPDTIKVTLDPNGTPAECTNVVVVDMNTITCTTSAHVAGKVDVQIGEGANIVTLEKGYEYIDDVQVPNTGAGSIDSSDTNETPVSAIIIATISLLGVAGFIANKFTRKVRLKK